MNRKLIALVLFVMIVSLCFVQSKGQTADFSKFVSGRRNIRVEGTLGQNGYIAFGDGNGTDLGYIIWKNTGGVNSLAWCCASVQDLTAGTFDMGKLIPLTN